MLTRIHSRNSAIMFDVGAAGVRAFQAVARGSSLSGRDSLQLGLLPAERQDNSEPPPPDYSRLARLVGQGNFAGSDVGLVLSPPDVRFYALRLPKKALGQPKKRVREALAWEVAREMRADAHALEVRYWSLPPGHQQGLNVMAVALPTERALEWHKAFAGDRLRLRRIDVSPCALVHLACRMWTPADNELWGVLDLGFRRATLTVVLGRVPAYIRSLSASCDRWTRRLAEAFDVSHAEAERIKCAHGISPAERGIRESRPDQPLLNARDIPGVIFGLLREPLEDLTREINLCFAYVLQHFPDVNVTQLVLAGGGANLRGFPQYLAQQLGVSVALLRSDSQSQPVQWERPLSGTTVQPAAAAAVGGALLDVETS